MPIPPQVPPTRSYSPEAKAFPLRLPEVMRIGGRGFSKCATSCSKDRALLALGVADQAEEDSGVAEVDLVAEEDSAAVVADLAPEDLAVVEETGREAGRE